MSIKYMDGDSDFSLYAYNEKGFFLLTWANNDYDIEKVIFDIPLPLDEVYWVIRGYKVHHNLELIDSGVDTKEGSIDTLKEFAEELNKI